MYAEKGKDFDCPACGRKFGEPPECCLAEGAGISKKACPMCGVTIKFLPLLDDGKVAVFDRLIKEKRLPKEVDRVGAGKARN